MGDTVVDKRKKGDTHKVSPPLQFRLLPVVAVALVPQVAPLATMIGCIGFAGGTTYASGGRLGHHGGVHIEVDYLGYGGYIGLLHNRMRYLGEHESHELHETECLKLLFERFE